MMEEIEDLHNSILSLCSEEEGTCTQKNKDDGDDELDGDFIDSLKGYSPGDETITVNASPKRTIIDLCESGLDISNIPVSPVTPKPSEVKPSSKDSSPNRFFGNDDLNISSILKSPVDQNDGCSKPLTKNVPCPSTPLVPGFKIYLKPPARAQSTPLNFLSQPSARAQSTPLNFLSQKETFQPSVKTRHNLFQDEFMTELGLIKEVEEDVDPSVTFEDLLSDLSSMLEEDSGKDKPAKMKAKELHLLKPENQISRIDLDSILLESAKPRSDDLHASSCSSIVSNLSDGGGKPGRFTTLNATVRPTVIEEADEEGEETDDILGLDDYIYSGMIDDDEDELSSDEEKTLLFDDSALCKTVIKNRSKEPSKTNENTTESYKTARSNNADKTDIDDTLMKSSGSSTLYQTIGSVVGFNKTLDESTQKGKSETEPSKTTENTTKSYKTTRSNNADKTDIDDTLMKSSGSSTLYQTIGSVVGFNKTLDESTQKGKSKTAGNILSKTAEVSVSELSDEDMKLDLVKDDKQVMKKMKDIETGSKVGESDLKSAETSISKEKLPTAESDTSGVNEKTGISEHTDESDKAKPVAVSFRDEKSKVMTCKVAPVMADTGNDKSDEKRTSFILSKDNAEMIRVDASEETKKSENVKSEIISQHPLEPEFVKDDNVLMREVAKRWNSKGIPKPDTNLTFAYWARTNLGLLRGQLEGEHLSTLEETRNNEKMQGDRYEPPPSKRQKTKPVMPMPNIKANLQNQIDELNAIERYNAEDILQERKHVIMNLKIEGEQRFRNLCMEQQLEIRQLFVQLQACLINRIYFDVQMLQLRQEHQLQKIRLHNFFKEQIKDRESHFYQKVNEKNQQYTQRKQQLNCLLQQLENQPKLVQNKNLYGPHVTVDLVKGPCVTNNQKCSVVTVCLPADIAGAIIKEDEIYDRFYVHPNLTKKDLMFKKKKV